MKDIHQFEEEIYLDVGFGPREVKHPYKINCCINEKCGCHPAKKKKLDYTV